MNNGEYLDSSERLDIGTTLKMFARYAARSIGREHEVGSLESGKFANFIMFDRDPKQSYRKLWATLR